MIYSNIQTGPNGSRSSCDVGKVCEGVCNAGSIRVMNLETERVKLRNIRFKDFKHICDYSKYRTRTKMIEIHRDQNLEF